MVATLNHRHGSANPPSGNPPERESEQGTNAGHQPGGPQRPVWQDALLALRNLTLGALLLAGAGYAAYRGIQ